MYMLKCQINCSLDVQMLEDFVYLLGEERLFVLLRVGGVLVVNTLTNPTSTLQLWTPAAGNSILCITTVRDALG